MYTMQVYELCTLKKATPYVHLQTEFIDKNNNIIWISTVPILSLIVGRKDESLSTQNSCSSETQNVLNELK